MNTHDAPQAGTTLEQTYNPWSIVHLVFRHLVGEGLYPVLGEGGDPGAPAADLLRALGIEPDAAGNMQVRAAVHGELTRLRTRIFPDVE